MRLRVQRLTRRMGPPRDEGAEAHINEDRTRVVVGCGGLLWVAVGCCGLRWVAVGFSGFQWVSVGFSGFQWVQRGNSRFFLAVREK